MPTILNIYEPRFCRDVRRLKAAAEASGPSLSLVTLVPDLPAEGEFCGLTALERRSESCAFCQLKRL